MALKLREKKQVVSRLRRKSENELKKAKSLKRKSSSGLARLQKKLEYAKEDLSEVSDVLTHKLAQKESITRLIASAGERLGRENEAKSQTESEVEMASNDIEKQYAKERLAEIEAKISDLQSEIKNRQKTAEKLESEILSIQNSKTKISTNIQKQTHVKPTLMATIKTSNKEAEILEKKLESTKRQEESVIKSLSKIQERLAKIKSKRKVAKKKTRLAKKAVKPKKSSKPRKAAKKKTRPAKKANKRKARQ